MKVTSPDKLYIYLVHKNSVIVYKHYTKIAVFSDFELHRNIKWKVGEHEGSFYVRKYAYVWKVTMTNNMKFYSPNINVASGSKYRIKKIEKLTDWIDRDWETYAYFLT